MARINFSAKTFGLTGKYKIREDIMRKLQADNAARAEIRRIFQVANRRIQNIESKGLISPAVQALNKGSVQGFTKFSMRHDWDELKREYSKAISFLHQATSSATGTREYNKHIQQVYELSDDEFGLMAKKLNDKIMSLSDSDFVERYLMRYKDFTGELEREVGDVSQQIEREAVSVQKAIDKETEAMDYTTEEVIDNLTKLFDAFEL